MGPGGAPISGALIEVRSTPSYAGATAASLARPRTRTDGTFSIRVPAGEPSATISFAYRANLGEPTPAATGALALTVRARVALSVSPRTVTVGHRIVFRGHLQGGPIPPGGKPLVLQARSGGGRWITFDVVRSDRSGRFHASYRFRFPGPVHYDFRAVCEAEADYPYAAATSNAVGVREL
jgi:hypothetical protein